MASVITRRSFLTTSALTIAQLKHSGRAFLEIPVSIPSGIAARRRALGAHFPESPLPEHFRVLARAAMEAANAAGADFADIRIGVQRVVSVPPWPLDPRAGMMVGYGVRARIRGTWGFQHGSILTTEAVRAAAQSAVRGASQYALVNQRIGQRRDRSNVQAGMHGATSALAPAPVVAGEWSSPCQIDPFTVPLDDYYRVIGSIVDTTARVHRNRQIRCGGLGWRADTRVFASTAGSMVTQSVVRGGPGINGYVSLPDNPGDQVLVDLPGLEATSAGFEVALRQDWIDYLLTGIDEAVRLRELPLRPFQDVGRFPIVFAGAAFANLVGATASMALDGERVTGIEADASGTSFCTPPAEYLNSSIPTFSPLLTLTVDRALPSTTAVQWDDEGVVPEPYTVVEQGRVVDYHTTRETAPILAEWYATRGQSVHSHGGTVAVTPASLPVCSSGHLTVTSAPNRVSIDDLIRDVQHGFVIRSGETNPEPGLTAGTLGGTPALEVKHGTVVTRTHLPVQFATKALLKEKLVALGDASTVRTTSVSSSKGIPWLEMTQPVTAPAALCKDVDVFTWSYTPGSST